MFQSAESTDALHYFFRATEHGIFHAWKVPRGPNGSSVVVETPAETLRVSGLDRAPRSGMGSRAYFGPVGDADGAVSSA